jgi:hypothetical protein
MPACAFSTRQAVVALSAHGHGAQLGGAIEEHGLDVVTVETV